MQYCLYSIQDSQRAVTHSIGGGGGTMAHELEIRDGRASFFEIGQRRTAWHREGVLLPPEATYDEALAAGRLNYVVEVRPTFHRTIVGEHDGQPVYQYVENRTAYVTVRADTGRELGAVGPDYAPIQNVDAFRAFEPLLDAGLLTLDAGGVLRDGADAWLCARFDLEKFGPRANAVLAGELAPYAVLNCNHNGRRQASLSLTAVRQVCANTQALVEARQD